MDGNIPISVLEYKELSGRAGRPSYYTFGESIIVAESGISEQEIYDHYVMGEPEPLRSQMSNDRAIRIHLLSTIVTFPGMKKLEIYHLFVIHYSLSNTEKRQWDFKIDNVWELSTTYNLS